MDNNIFKFLKFVLNLIVAITLASCGFESGNNIIQSENIDTNKTNNKTKSSVSTKKSQPNNLAANNNNGIGDLERLTHQQINQYRISRNLPPLKLDKSISQQARIHSQNMAQDKVPFSHEGFEGRIASVSSTISYRSAAENIAYNQGYRDPVERAVAGWIKSPGHHKNMIGNYNLTGIGMAKNSQGEYYFTQIFVLENNF